MQRAPASVQRGGDGSQGPVFSTCGTLVLYDSSRAQLARVCVPVLRDPPGSF